MYQKRNNIGKFWPVSRKGTKFLSVSSHNNKTGIPLVVVTRDILKITRTKKELKSVLNENKVEINKRVIKDANYPVCLFDILSFPGFKKHYQMILGENKKMKLEEVSEKESNKRIFKVIGKKILKNKVSQINLINGRNLISNEKVKSGDSILMNLKENKIIKLLKLEKGKNVFIESGRHAGKRGKIEGLVERGGKQIAKIKSEDEKINVWVRNIVVIE